MAGIVQDPSQLPAVASQRVVDPVLELVGWKMEPLMLKRLKWYLVEGILEWVALALTIHMAELHLSAPAAVQRLALMPWVVVTFRVCWAIGLLVGYCSIRGVDVQTAIKRLSCVHRRGCWSCSQVMFVASSCALMVWYLILLFFVAPFNCNPAEGPAAMFILIIIALCIIAHWVLYRDFVRNYVDQANEFDLNQTRLIYNMYRKREIQLAKHGALVAAAHIGPDAAPAAPSPSTLCAVCLEDFQKEDIVSQLPCGHIFHPTCAHRWMCENWRCPLRCALNENPRRERPVGATVAEAQPAQEERRAADPELGIVPSAAGHVVERALRY
mmetsp:Transcript_122598/g.261636  ORF Transcript_122598/g.261636 Transcript_122598/m.261636 type:complete len:327 (-) Transcript_122598:28-1008(-)